MSPLNPVKEFKPFSLSSERRKIVTFITPPPFIRYFTLLLGSTNPYTINVHKEPFSTSVFKILIWILATTTKIRTKENFIPIQMEIFSFSSRPPTLCCKFA